MRAISASESAGNIWSRRVATPLGAALFIRNSEFGESMPRAPKRSIGQKSLSIETTTSSDGAGAQSRSKHLQRCTNQEQHKQMEMENLEHERLRICHNGTARRTLFAVRVVYCIGGAPACAKRCAYGALHPILFPARAKESTP